MTEALIAIAIYIAFIAVIVRCLRANGPDTDTREAVDSVRAALESDARLDEMRDYTRPHMRAGSAWGEQP